MTKEERLESEYYIVEHWGEAGEKVIQECREVEPINLTTKQFLDYCTPCGGDWGQMLLSGLKALRPTVWEAIPDNMGQFAWSCICETLSLCGIITD